MSLELSKMNLTLLWSRRVFCCIKAHKSIPADVLFVTNLTKFFNNVSLSNLHECQPKNRFYRFHASIADTQKGYLLEYDSVTRWEWWVSCVRSCPHAHVIKSNEYAIVISILYASHLDVNSIPSTNCLYCIPHHQHGPHRFFFFSSSSFVTNHNDAIGSSYRTGWTRHRRSLRPQGFRLSQLDCQG